MNKIIAMRTKELRIFVYEYPTLYDLPEADQKLVLAAREASGRAFAPYSRFNVGAALLLENHEIITGNNQENAASPTGLCAERVALFYANATYPDIAVKAMAVTASNNNGLVDGPVKPCGSCRQAMVETEVRYKQTIRIILDGKKKIQVFEGVENLLPFAFKPESLD
ncbi:cytidine deaminase [Mariniphaga sp.]|uniref:cytidine deaminase n=1 Tax=Mariniphaga sp. TaxID=1954475 RepID=UPI00356A071A